ncbi:MAG: hypothetical protein M3680_11795 [Myxococcota bacterium]|nr:hypothetical protein [Myxococcota bacterium]
MLIAGALAACGRDDATTAHASSPLERSIETQLGTRLGVGVRVRCTALPPRCRATLPDASTLPLRLARRAGQLEWAVDGMLVEADVIEAYLRDVVAELGAPQSARCGTRIRSVAAGDRIECALERGGKAFITVHADATTRVEIDLDPVAGDARAEHVTMTREQELVQMSLELEHADTPAEE